MAQRLKQESSSPQLVDTFSDNNSTGWTAAAGTWSLTTTPPNGYAYQQTDTTSTATNSYRTLTQNSLSSYTWQMTFQSFGSTPRGAGFYFFGSDATNNSYHGYAYSVWQTESQVQLCENAVNGSTCQVNNNFTATTGTTYRYQITYNPVTGQFLLWRDGVLAIAWTDSTPLTSGNHIAFRTQKSNVRFDDIRVTTYTSNFHYFFSDHLGSTSVLSNSSGAEVSGSRAYHLPFGSYRGTPPSQTLTDRSFTGQKENMELGLMYYNARYYTPGLGRFVSADTIVPDPANPQSFNRYSYTYNNPVKYIDPTGHRTCTTAQLEQDFETCDQNLGTGLDNTNWDASAEDELAEIPPWMPNWWSAEQQAMPKDQWTNQMKAEMLEYNRQLHAAIQAHFITHIYPGAVAERRVPGWKGTGLDLAYNTGLVILAWEVKPVTYLGGERIKDLTGAMDVLDQKILLLIQAGETAYYGPPVETFEVAHPFDPNQKLQAFSISSYPGFIFYRTVLRDPPRVRVSVPQISPETVIKLALLGAAGFAAGQFGGSGPRAVVH